jgi:hypothetical protein
MYTMLYVGSGLGKRRDRPEYIRSLDHSISVQLASMFALQHVQSTFLLPLPISISISIFQPQPRKPHTHASDGKTSGPVY